MGACSAHSTAALARTRGVDSGVRFAPLRGVPLLRRPLVETGVVTASIFMSSLHLYLSTAPDRHWLSPALEIALEARGRVQAEQR